MLRKEHIKTHISQYGYEAAKKRYGVANLIRFGLAIEYDVRMDLVDKILSVIKKHGEFSAAEVEADCSPCIESRGNIVHLIERFEGNALVVAYKDKVEVDNYSVEYFRLETDTLNSIMELCSLWEKEHAN